MFAIVALFLTPILSTKRKWEENYYENETRKEKNTAERLPIVINPAFICE